MTEQEYIELRLMDSDIKYIQKRGLIVKLVPNTNERFDVPYMTHIIQGNHTEIISTPYHLEQIVNVLKMAERARRNKYHE